MASPTRSAGSGKRLAVATVCTFVMAITVGATSAAVASGAYPGNETALPPPPLDTSPACPPNQVTNPGFVDIAGDFFELQIECLADYGVTNGTSPSTYAPSQLVSRGQMAALFFRLGQLAHLSWNTAAPSPNYADADQIPADFVDAVNALTNAGIVAGFGDHTYRPAAPVSRGEMSKFIFNAFAFAGVTPDASGQDYFYDDDGSNFEAFLNGDAALGVYVGSPGPNGGEVARPAETVPRDQTAGFLARILAFAVYNGRIPTRFVPTTVGVSPSSVPVGSNVLVTVNGANVADVSVSGPCTPGASQTNTPAPDNASQAITLTVPMPSSATPDWCTLTVVVTDSDGSTHTFMKTVDVTAAAAPPGTYHGFSVVSLDRPDAQFEATNGTDTFTFTYGQPGSSYRYNETPGAGGSTSAQAISLSQFASFLSWTADPAAGDTVDMTYGGEGTANTFAITQDVPGSPQWVVATYVTSPTPGVRVTWTAPVSPDVAAYRVRAGISSGGPPPSYTDVGMVSGSQSGGVVTQAPPTTFLDTSEPDGAVVVYQIFAIADGHNGGAASYPGGADGSAVVTVGGTGGTAPPGDGPTNPAIAAITRPSASPAGATLNVSSDGADSASCGPSASPCLTIGQAIANAASGDTVHVAPGLYHEQVVVSKPLTVQGFGATLDASGLSQGSGQSMDAAAVLVPQGGSGSRIEGLTVHGAYGEGILVLGASDVVVTGNTVSGNDLGTPTNTAYLECQAQGEIPGDCGEGIHLMSATNSQLVDNVSTSNSGGILVTDELGPATGNTVDGNLVQRNFDDCGITLPSHSPDALDASGTPQPTMGGVFGNTVSHNMVFENGLRGAGAGVLIAAAGPGSASYDNTVTGNVISGNGLAGVTIHSHTPNQNVSGNVIEGNTIGQNNILGDPDANDTVTTGIIVFSASVPTTETISNNTIYDNEQQIFTSSNVTIA